PTILSCSSKIRSSIVPTCLPEGSTTIVPIRSSAKLQENQTAGTKKLQFSLTKADLKAAPEFKTKEQRKAEEEAAAAQQQMQQQQLQQQPLQQTAPPAATGTAPSQ